MGTNFYWTKIQPWFLENAKNVVLDLKGDCENPVIHIGKRSAAGLYCTKCGCTINRCGTQSIHSEAPDIAILSDPHLTEERKQREWARQKSMYYFDECPCCGTPFLDENNEPSDGIKSICSFRWTLMKHKELLMNLALDDNSEKVVRDEYDRLYTAKEFWNKEFSDFCLIEFQDGNYFG